MCPSLRRRGYPAGKNDDKVEQWVYFYVHTMWLAPLCCCSRPPRGPEGKLCFLLRAASRMAVCMLNCGRCRYMFEWLSAFSLPPLPVGIKQGRVANWWTHVADNARFCRSTLIGRHQPRSIPVLSVVACLTVPTCYRELLPPVQEGQGATGRREGRSSARRADATRQRPDGIGEPGRAESRCCCHGRRSRGGPGECAYGCGR